MKISAVPRVAAIHDLSGFGRTSLTSIMPILSYMGIQVCPLPTAILSNHTGGYDTYSFVDFTDYMTEYIEGWKNINIEFDCIYSGFLGSERQIDIVSKFMDDFRTEDNMIVVDPVLGDNGKTYATISDNHVKKMRDLVRKADIITPNFTEVALLLEQEYKENANDEEVKEYLKKLAEMGPKIVVATSVPEKNGADSNVIAYDSSKDTFWKVPCKYIPTFFPGTGDAYASVMIGSLLKGDSLPIALDRGVQFITQAIRASYGFEYDNREGILLERVLKVLDMPAVLGGYEMI